jgi:hypothetical protein
MDTIRIAVTIRSSSGLKLFRRCFILVLFTVRQLQRLRLHDAVLFLKWALSQVQLTSELKS